MTWTAAIAGMELYRMKKSRPAVIVLALALIVARGGTRLAGAILSYLPARRSPEADGAVAMFERYRDSLVATLDECGTGRELDGRGHHQDKFIAGELDLALVFRDSMERPSLVH